MKENRRKYVRIDQAFEVSFHEVKEFLSIGERSKNISEGGICLPLNHYYEVGSLLEVEIRSDDFKVPVKALARIAWIVRQDKGELPFQAGFEFLEVSPVQRDMLREYIKRYCASSGNRDIRWLE